MTKHCTRTRGDLRRAARRLLVLSAVLLAAAVSAQPRHCDPDLPVSTSNPLAYRLRGERCEGVYVQEVSATPLAVVSLGQFTVPDPPGRSLHLTWTPPAGKKAGASVRLRAASVRPRTYYRMDSEQPDGTTAFDWPTDVVSALGLSWTDLGIVATTQETVGGRLRDVYLPVRIGTPPAGRETTYELALMPGGELSEVFVGLAPVLPDGRPGSTAPMPLGYGYYPAGRSIRIPLGPVGEPGLYFVEIGATLRGGGAVGQEVWFRAGR